MNDTKIQKDINFFPHEGQRAILECKEREVVLCAGRRWGKSAVCAYLALRVLLENEKKVWIVSPSYDLSLKVFEYLTKWLYRMLGDDAPPPSYRPYPKIKLPNGSQLECKSAENPTGLLGEELDLLIVDEAARISRLVYEQYLYPTTSSRQGSIIFISTPFGKNWFYEKWVQAKETGAAFNFESRNNPEFPEKEWERAKKILPEQVFKQEYQANFLEDAASVFRGVHDIVSDTLEDAKEGHFYVLGVDLGRFEDYTVLTVIDRESRKVVYWDRFAKIDFELQKKRIAAAARRYNNAKIIIDSTTLGGSTKEDLEREGLLVEGIVFWNNVHSSSKASKRDIIEKLALFIEQKYILIPNEEVLIDELTSYGYQLTEQGNVKYGAPQGQHDDTVISLALVVWGLNPGSAGDTKTPVQEYIQKSHRQMRQPKKIRL